MLRKNMIFKQLVIPYTILFVPTIMEHVIKELSKSTFSILFIYKILHFIIYLICGILISELIRISLKHQDRFSSIVIVFNTIALLLIYMFITLSYLNSQIFLYTNILLIGCHIYMLIYNVQKKRG